MHTVPQGVATNNSPQKRKRTAVLLLLYDAIAVRDIRETPAAAASKYNFNLNKLSLYGIYCGGTYVHYAGKRKID